MNENKMLEPAACPTCGATFEAAGGDGPIFCPEHPEQQLEPTRDARIIGPLRPAAGTIYECPTCGLWWKDDRGPHEKPGSRPRLPDDTVGQGIPCPGRPVPVRVFREEDVRPLWEAARDVQRPAGVLSPRYGDLDRLDAAFDAFPAPEEWTT